MFSGLRSEWMRPSPCRNARLRSTYTMYPTMLHALAHDHFCSHLSSSSQLSSSSTPQAAAALRPDEPAQHQM